MSRMRRHHHHHYQSAADDSIEQDVLSEADSLALSEALSVDGEREHQAHIERSISRINSQLSVINEHIMTTTKSILEIVVKMELSMRRNFALWLTKYKEEQTKSSSQLIAASSLMITEMKTIMKIISEISNSKHLIEQSLSMATAVNNRLSQNERIIKKLETNLTKMHTDINDRFDLLFTEIADMKILIKGQCVQTEQQNETTNIIGSELRKLLDRQTISEEISSVNDSDGDLLPDDDDS